MSYYPGTNAGHGYVWERPDGARARCGGPAMCGECTKDFMDMCEFKAGLGQALTMAEQRLHDTIQRRMKHVGEQGTAEQ